MVSTDGFSLAATIILIFPMIYFAFATLTFFLAKMSDPIATRLLRGLFHVYFRVVVVLCSIGAIAFVRAGKPDVVLGLVMIVALAFLVGRFFVRQLDAQILARDAGDPRATRSLRRIHVGGLLYNLVQLGVIMASVPHMFAATT